MWNTSYRLLKRIQPLFESLLRKEAADFSTPPDRLTELSTSEDPEILYAVASNPATPPSTLEKLLKSTTGWGGGFVLNKDRDIQKKIRSSLATNPNTPVNMLKFLLGKGHVKEVLENPVTSLLGMEDPSWFTNDANAMSKLAKYPNLPEHMQMPLYSALSNEKNDIFKTSDIRADLLKNPSLQPGLLADALKKHAFQAVENPNVTADQLNELNKAAADRGDLYLQTRILKHPNMKTQDAINLAHSVVNSEYNDPTYGYGYNAKAISGLMKRPEFKRSFNDKYPEKHPLNKFTDDSSVQMLSSLDPGILGEPDEDKTPPDYRGLFHTLSYHPNENVRNNAINHLTHLINTDENISAEELAKYANHYNPDVKNAIATHPTTQEVRASYSAAEPVYKMSSDGPYLEDPPEPAGIRKDAMGLEGDVRHNYKRPSPLDRDDEYNDEYQYYRKTATQLPDDERTRSIAKTPLHPRMANFLSQSEDPEVRLSLAQNFTATPDALHALASDENKQVKMSVLNHPNTRLDTVNMMKTDFDPDVRKLASFVHNNRKFNKK